MSFDGYENDGVLPASPSPRPSSAAPGWYPDPWRVAAYRWFDGAAWTAHTGGSEARKPRLPAWISPLVIASGIPVGLGCLALAVVTPFAVALAFVPLFIVLPTLWWLDRVEPEPRAARVHAILWGATVAVFVSSIVNGVAAIAIGETFAAVVSAPLIEEAMKGLGVYWAVRARELDGPMDGIVYAGWVAAGFAVVENFLYFATADTEGQLVGVFVLRALLTPFAHPLFTTWIGLALGLAVAAGRRPFPSVLWGFALASATHALWNGSLSLADSTENALILLVAAAGFVVLFLAVAITLFVFRRREQQEFTSFVPLLASRYGLSPVEVQVFSDWRPMLRLRRSLPRSERRQFDRVHAALARLAELHSRPAGIDPTSEQRLAAELWEARSAPSP